MVAWEHASRLRRSQERIFGSEPHKHLLIQLLNTLLELEGDRRIIDLTYLPAEQMVPLPEMKLSIVDVKCVDERGTEYVVEMQLFNVKGFEERVVYRIGISSPRMPRDASKTFVMQLRSSEDYRHLTDVVGVTICDFELWPEPTEPGAPAVPMLSRWRMQERHTGAKRLGQVQYVFLELPKYEGGPILRASWTSGPTSSVRRRIWTSFRRSSTRPRSGRRSRWRGWRA